VESRRSSLPLSPVDGLQQLGTGRDAECPEARVGRGHRVYGNPAAPCAAVVAADRAHYPGFALGGRNGGLVRGCHMRRWNGLLHCAVAGQRIPIARMPDGLCMTRERREVRRRPCSRATGRPWTGMCPSAGKGSARKMSSAASAWRRLRVECRCPTPGLLWVVHHAALRPMCGRLLRSRWVPASGQARLWGEASHSDFWTGPDLHAGSLAAPEVCLSAWPQLATLFQPLPPPLDMLEVRTALTPRAFLLGCRGLWEGWAWRSVHASGPVTSGL
jgi:hypothetical protein